MHQLLKKNSDKARRRANEWSNNNFYPSTPIENSGSIAL